MEGTVRGTEHLLRVKELAPEVEFYHEFDNTKTSHKTLLCFSLHQPGKTLWDFWGHTFNNPGKEHAEFLLLRVIEDFLTERGRPTAEEYHLTLWVSFSPCTHCCHELVSFVTLHRTVKVGIMMAKLYFPDNLVMQESLRQLQRSGVTLRVMAGGDFELCHDLFVNPYQVYLCDSTEFKKWPGLDERSDNYSAVLEAILQQHGDDSDPKYDALDGCAGERTPLRSLVAPDACAAGDVEGPETPQKADRSPHNTDHVQSVNRQLFPNGTQQ